MTAHIAPSAHSARAHRLIGLWLALQILPATAVEAPAAANSASSTGNLLQVLFGLVIVLGLMAGAAWLLKRFNLARSPGGQTVKIIGGVNVGSRERVMVVEVADQWIVVGVAPGSVNALATMPRQEMQPILETQATQPNFAAWLKQTIDKRNASQA